MKECLWVFLGGGAGSVARYLLTVLGRQLGVAGPWPTLAINVLGCVLIGLFSGLLGRSMLGRESGLLLTVGLCGGFTTFSTFGNEALGLLRDGRYPAFAVYVCGSVLLGLAGVWGGIRWADCLGR